MTGTNEVPAAPEPSAPASAVEGPATTGRWMRVMLWVAGIYNVVWGTFVVCFPLLPFQWAHMEPPRYPEIWQSVGMIVGVYGVGYIIAAYDPVRHWPIVLIGFLGKLFGPIGMADAIWHGRLPPVAGLVCVTNDLIWWIPFALTLWHAYRVTPDTEKLTQS